MNRLKIFSFQFVFKHTPSWGESRNFYNSAFLPFQDTSSWGESKNFHNSTVTHNALTQVAIRSHITTKSWAANCSGIFWQYYLQMTSRCNPTRPRKNLSTIISFSSRMLFLPNSERLNCTLSFGRSRLQAVEVLLLFTELGIATVLY